jgi:HK97 family phage portal protein
MVTDDVWRSQLAWSQVTDGNAFGLILEKSSTGLPLMVEWIDPSMVSERKVENGRAYVKIENKVHALFPHGDILHIPGRMIPAGTPFAISPLEYANRSIGTSLAAEQFSADWFSGGGHPTAVYRSDQPMTGEQIQAFKAMVVAAEQSRQPIVMGAGIEREAVQDSPDDVVLSLLQWEVLQACRFWHVPPSWVYAAVSGQSVTYANVAQADVDGLKRTLDGYLVRSEKALSRCLPQPQVCRANRDAALRVDAETRARVQALRLANKLMSVNEGRKQEDDTPWPDPMYDDPGIPGDTFPTMTIAPPAAPEPGAGA